MLLRPNENLQKYAVKTSLANEKLRGGLNQSSSGMNMNSVDEVKYELLVFFN